jgi:hypothetical protein
MPVYTVHAPTSVAASRSASADGVVFVRDGFHGWAFLAGPFWLIVNRLWLALAGYLALNVVLTIVLSGLHASAGTRFAALLLIALLLGLEAATLKRWTLARRGWRQLDVVIADDEDTAERRFFDRWSDKAPDFYQPPVERGGPPPARSPSSAQGEIFGLFPNGARR